MKAFIIRLKNNSISEKHADECVRQAKIFDIGIEYFDAINGNDYPAHLKRLNISPRYKFKKGRAGVFGCFLSHHYLWKQCVEHNVPYLILEHDGYFLRPLPTDILEKFEDVLKLDGLDPYSKQYDSFFQNIDHDVSIKIEEYYNPQAKFLEKNQTGNYMRGAYGYIIKPHAAKKIIEWIALNGFVPADQQIGNAIVDIKVTTPSIVRLHPNYFGKIGALSLTGNPSLL
jgi:GR25 family glycosyltransferase involved in LPS biosynthesis